MSSWKLKLMNIQRVCKDHIWEVPPPPGLSLPGPSPLSLDMLVNSGDCCRDPVGTSSQVPPLQGPGRPLLGWAGASPEMVRIPANSKSRFSLGQFQCHKVHQCVCYSFIASCGINRDLARPISKDAKMVAHDYVTPPETRRCTHQPPEMLAVDLYRCIGTERGNVHDRGQRP